MVGNKSDYVSERKIEYEEGKALADRYGMEFMETSAKEGTNVGKFNILNTKAGYLNYSVGTSKSGWRGRRSPSNQCRWSKLHSRKRIRIPPQRSRGVSVEIIILLRQ
jgi:hypothetical protein